MLNSKITFEADVTSNVNDQYKYHLWLKEITFKRQFDNYTGSSEMNLIEQVQKCQNSSGFWKKIGKSLQSMAKHLHYFLVRHPISVNVI